MSVCVLGPAIWGAAAVAAASATGSATRLVGVSDDGTAAGRATLTIDRFRVAVEASSLGVTLADAVPADARVALASFALPHALVAAFFAAPAAVAGRKIVAVTADGKPAGRLLDVADMLIFSPAAFARLIDAEAEAEGVAALLPVQGLLTRPNQAAVVPLPGVGLAAVWADRTMLVAGPGRSTGIMAMARMAGTIAAAVDQGIGPERAMEMALAAAGEAEA